MAQLKRAIHEGNMNFQWTKTDFPKKKNPLILLWYTNVENLLPIFWKEEGRKEGRQEARKEGRKKTRKEGRVSFNSS